MYRWARSKDFASRSIDGDDSIRYLDGHALTIDSGWREVADTALAFVQRFVKP
jgi:hypothetical protein